jgi:hypothetical protein
MFNISLARINLYLDTLKRSGTKWIGLQFYFLLLWCTSKVYKIVQHWNEFIEVVALIEIDKSIRYHEGTESGHEAYNWIIYLLNVKNTLNRFHKGCLTSSVWGRCWSSILTLFGLLTSSLSFH